MPIGRTWRLIGGIYAIVFLLVVLRVTSGLYQVPSDGMGAVAAYPRGTIPYDPPGARVVYSADLPPGFEMTYRGTEIGSHDIHPADPLDWSGAERQILNRIASFNRYFDGRVEPLLTQQEIDDALAEGPSYDQGPMRGFITWSTLSVSVGDNQFQASIPSALVSNEEVKKAVKIETQRRVHDMLKALRSMVTAGKSPTTDSL